MKFFTNHSLRQFLKVTTLSLFLVSLVFSPRVAFAQVTVLGDVQRVVQGSTGILDTILNTQNTFDRPSLGLIAVQSCHSRLTIGVGLVCH